MEPAKNPAPPQEQALHFLDYWRIVRIRKTVIISVFFLVAITATVVTFILPPYYSSTAQVEVNQASGVISSMSGTPATAETAYDPYLIETQLKLINGQDVLDRVISKLDLNDRWGGKYNSGGAPFTTDQTMGILQGRINLNPELNTKLINIMVMDPDKNEAAELANAIADAYQAYRLNQQNTNTSQGIEALQRQAEGEQAAIQVARSNVDYLRKALKIADTDPSSVAPTPTLNNLQLQTLANQRVEDEKNYMSEEKVLEELQALQSTNPALLADVLPTMENDTTLDTLLDKLHQTEQSLAQQSAYYTTNLPDIQSLEKLKVELNREIDNRVKGLMLGLNSKVTSLKAEVDGIDQEVESAKQKDEEEVERGAPYWEAKQDLENKISFQTLMAAKISQEETDLAIPKTTMVTITERAQPGDKPVRPRKTLNIVLGSVFGLLIGIGLAFFIEYLDTSVKTIDELERTLQVPVLGVIPQDAGVLANESLESHHAEAYRVLRTNILFSRKDEKLNTMVVVSAGAGEGKSTTVTNLATTFAQAGQRVLLVDSDLRRPTLHKVLGANNSRGLTNYLLKQNTLDEVIQRTSVPTLDLLPSGRLPSSSMNLLGSTPMKNLISELKQRYEYIFFDSPPIVGVSDAAILASEVDMAIQVIQYRRYPQAMNVRAKQMVEKVGGNLVGIVLNNINLAQDESYYYYSGYYHNYYYSKDEDEQASDDGKEEPGRVQIKSKY
ncbi:MAG: polysaccharide biosynthesis tyrosine autokinase [Verrucomicrobiota bacterium]|nr:polysaccharide biosynthesis tyrosine autokinase [Verrucomicrobiota bacterium]